jgi:hypothetical protein
MGYYLPAHPQDPAALKVNGKIFDRNLYLTKEANMKSRDFSKIIKAGVLAAGLMLLPIAPSVAQTETNTDSPTVDTTPFQESENDPGNWGWLGLIGLIGLANLFRKPKTTEVYREPDVSSSTGYRE